MLNEDIKLAKSARLNAYSPYSNFQVGAALQFMSEFVDNNFKICVVDKNNNVEELTISELLPYSFKF